MGIRFDVSRADFTLEAAYQAPEFAAFRDTSRLLHRLFGALRPHGVKLSDLKIERGRGTLDEFYVLCYLFDFLMTIRVRLDRMEINCSYLAAENVQRFSGAVVDALTATRGHLSGDYRTYTFSLSLHGTLDGVETKKFLGAFVAKTPEIGPATGNAIGYYFGPTEDRLTATITLDISAVVPGGLFLRPQATWDGAIVATSMLPVRAEAFARSAVTAVGLALPLEQ